MFSSPGPRVELLKHFLAKLVPGRQGLDGPSVLGEILQLKDASFWRPSPMPNYSHRSKNSDFNNRIILS